MGKSYILRDLPPEERPRERLRAVGVENLSVQELLALIIEKGGKGKSVLTTAQTLLAHFGNLTNLKSATLEQMQSVPGIGFATACKLQAAFQLGEKALYSPKFYGQKIERAADVFNLLKREIGAKQQEYFKVLSLNSRKVLITIDNISLGTVDTSLAHPREVFRPAIQNSAKSILLAHNHPSGDVRPSTEDIVLTKQLIEVGNLLGIRVIDHIILSQENYYSFKEGR